MIRSNNDTNDCQYLLIVMRFGVGQLVAFRTAKHHCSGPWKVEEKVHYHRRRRDFSANKMNGTRTKTVCPARKSHLCKHVLWVPTTTISTLYCIT